MGWNPPRDKLRKFSENVKAARKAESECDFAAAAVHFSKAAKWGGRTYSELAEKCRRLEKPLDRALQKPGL